MFCRRADRRGQRHWPNVWPRSAPHSTDRAQASDDQDHLWECCSEMCTIFCFRCCLRCEMKRRRVDFGNNSAAKQDRKSWEKKHNEWRNIGAQVLHNSCKRSAESRSTIVPSTGKHHAPDAFGTCKTQQTGRTFCFDTFGCRDDRAKSRCRGKHVLLVHIVNAFGRRIARQGTLS